MFAALGLFNWDETDSRSSKSAWAVSWFVILAVYFWSGIQKANMTFATQVFPFLTQPLGPSIAHAVKPFWFVAPLVETSIALSLFVPRIRVIGLVGLMVMHGFNLFVLGPLGQNYDSIVWPWNFWIAVMAFCLFFRNDEWLIRTAWASNLGKAIVVLVGILPAFNYFERWDGFLSMSYYSGRLLDAWIYLTPNGAAHLPAAYTTDNPALIEDSPGLFRMDITKWAYGRLNVPPYAEPRVYVGLMKRLEAAGVPKKDMTLLLRDRNALSSSAQTYSQVEY